MTREQDRSSKVTRSFEFLKSSISDRPVELFHLYAGIGGRFRTAHLDLNSNTPGSLFWETPQVPVTLGDRTFTVAVKANSNFNNRDCQSNNPADFITSTEITVVNDAVRSVYEFSAGGLPFIPVTTEGESLPVLTISELWELESILRTSLELHKKPQGRTIIFGIDKL